YQAGAVASVELDAADRQRSSCLTCGLHRRLTMGARNASRFRSELRTKMEIAAIKEAPGARLTFWEEEKERPKKASRK
ncbi:hypothetical protein, partial [Rhizobium sp. NFACC06-2]|uniref:hypothetical protein n=1 Tax=Rhizobium sp. NFACC06-2 TaxID=1566264 RepID=UPI001AEEA0A2